MIRNEFHKVIHANVTAAQNDSDATVRLRGTRKHICQCDRAGRLEHEFEMAHCESHRMACLRVRHCVAASQHLPVDRESDRSRFIGHERIAQCLGMALNDLPAIRFERPSGFVVAFWLDCENFAVGILGPDTQAASRDKPTTAAWREHRIQSQSLGTRIGCQLDANRSLPGNDVGMIECGHECRAFFLRDMRCDMFAILTVAIVQHDVRTERPGIELLDLGRILRHDDRGIDAEPLRGKRDPLSVISGRVSNDARATLGMAELEQSIECAPDLESASVLQ